MRKRLLLILGSACLLAVPASARSGQGTAGPTWNKDVAPIVYANCITCHRPGEVAPMSLLTFADARPWARGMKAKVMAHEMPPWFADPRYGKFQNKRGLTEVQIDTIAAWADGGAPQGTGPAPVAPNFGERSAELMDRAPDYVYEGPVEIEIPAAEVMPNIRVWERVPFADDKYLELIQHDGLRSGKSVPLYVYQE